MAQSFKETAHLKTDIKKYQDNYDKIFNKNKEDKVTCFDNSQHDRRIETELINFLDNPYLCATCDNETDEDTEICEKCTERQN